MSELLRFQKKPPQRGEPATASLCCASLLLRGSAVDKCALTCTGSQPWVLGWGEVQWGLRSFGKIDRNLLSRKNDICA